jgi:nucleoside-diphosphate-sugar epimerase
MKRVLVTGAAGMLGSQIVPLRPSGVRRSGRSSSEAEALAGEASICATRRASTSSCRAHGPFTGVIHAAACTAVDLAERKRATRGART